MTRMSREFSLVLLGSGVLSAGYFLAPSPDDELERKADEQAAARVGHAPGTTYHHRPGMPLVMWVHGPGYAGGGTAARPAASPAVARSGFGGVGRSMGAAGGGA